MNIQDILKKVNLEGGAYLKFEDGTYEGAIESVTYTDRSADNKGFTIGFRIKELLTQDSYTARYNINIANPYVHANISLVLRAIQNITQQEVNIDILGAKLLETPDKFAAEMSIACEGKDCAFVLETKNKYQNCVIEKAGATKNVANSNDFPF